MKTIFIFLITLIYSHSILSQEPSPFMKDGFIGYSIKNINFKPKGFENRGNWEGVEMDLGGMSFSYHQGQVRAMGADSTMGNPKGSSAMIGFKVGPDNWRLGSNSFFSMSIKPYLKISGAVLEASNRVLDEDITSFGLVASPGLELRFSHIYLNLNYDAGLYTNGSINGKNLNIAKGYVGGTTVTIGIQNAFDLLIPRNYSFKGYNVTKEKYRTDKTTFEYNNYRQRYEFVRRITEKTITSYSPGERVLAMVKPFWGVGPSYSYHAQRERQASTSMIGVNLGLRFSYFMIDGFYEAGSMGLKDKIGKKEIIQTYPVLRDFDFSSRVEVNHYGGRIGFNLSKFLAMSNFIPTDKNKNISGWYVPFTRVNGFFTMGFTEFNSLPNYTYEGASKRLQEYQSIKGFAPSAKNNPDYIPEKTMFTGWGLSLELGAAYFNWTKYSYKDATIANHSNFTIGANIPLGRIFHQARTSLFL